MFDKNRENDFVELPLSAYSVIFKQEKSFFNSVWLMLNVCRHALNQNWGKKLT